MTTVKCPIPLLEPYPTLSALYGVILDACAEDTPRLMFADACEEAADDGAPAAVTKWGEFVKLQFERHAIGPERFTVEQAHVFEKGGPGYYAFDTGDEAGIKPGDRVDVEVYLPRVDRERGKKARKYHGLKVVRISPADALGLVEVIAKEDAESTPYPEERVQYIEGRMAGMLANYERLWFPGLFDGMDRILNFGFAKGFVSRCVSHWHFWSRHCDTILSTAPVRSVEITDAVYVNNGNDRDNKRRVFQFGSYGDGHRTRALRHNSIYAGKAIAYRTYIEMQDAEDIEQGVILELLRKTWPSVTHWKFPSS